MFRDAKKALYVFLCGLMGSLLFLVIQRSIVLIYLVLLRLNPETFTVGLSLADLMALDALTVFLALMFGGWYGVWLGIHWYDVVYETKSFPGLGAHLTEVFSISNLRVPISTKNGKKKKTEFASFWEIDDAVISPKGKAEAVKAAPAVIHIKPRKVESVVSAPKTASKPVRKTTTTKKVTKPRTVKK